MTKQQLKKLIREALSEMSSNMPDELPNPYFRKLGKNNAAVVKALFNQSNSGFVITVNDTNESYTKYFDNRESALSYINDLDFDEQVVSIYKLGPSVFKK